MKWYQQELKRIIAHSLDNHAGSIRILEKLGCNKLGEMKAS
ncbi:hypothetical protein [Nostoc sp. UHCC 0302]